MADEFGNVHIMGHVDTGNLPASFDANYPEGANIWLVLSEDVNCQTQEMTGWNPTKYLFEFKLVTCQTECEEPEDHGHHQDGGHSGKHPEILKLKGPNPFNSATQFSYYLSEPGQVELEVYNVRGKKVVTLVQGLQSEGEHTVTWSANGFSSGVYFVLLNTAQGMDMKKVALLK